MKKIILASQSPRRRELMMMLNVPFMTVNANIDETMDSSKPVEDEVLRIAKAKAYSAKEAHPDGIIISADTIVCIDNEVLGKPKTKDKAIEMLKKLSGRTHEVITAVCILSDEKVINYNSKSKVTFSEISDEDIIKYVETKEPLDKAGAYAIQGQGALFIEKIEGNFYSIMGLPVNSIYYHLKELTNI